MTNVLELLQEDHDHFRLLLEAMHGEMELFLEGGEVDYELLDSGSDFLHAYAQGVHHPLEERLLADSAGVGPLQHDIEELERQHHRLEQALHDLRTAFSAIRDGQAFERRPLADATRVMVAGFREHMGWEEAVLFPALAGDPLHTATGASAGSDGDPVSILRPLEPRFTILLRRLR